ncbi:rRNA maturation RNase YbeY [uncultured Pelagimonas sp.]|uniref:rRNA maturation RNase YbeY n=1 Tax=uncultured Pelagimonas sp. TaxID=1618102 RepID=UPI002622102B|nr:rRNA maturation RNase YbeY [uncultured Pelagimonas sp.]
MTTDTVLEDPRWQEVDLVALAEQAEQGVFARLSLDPDSHEVVVMGCDDSRIKELNTDFRDKPRATNVLSWPYEDLSAETPGESPLAPEAEELGDIAIAFETCQREAQEQGKPMADHVTHLLVHGVLHLLGYDHIRDEDATLMEQLEVEILGKLGLPDPYRGDTGPAGL